MEIIFGHERMESLVDPSSLLRVCKEERLHGYQLRIRHTEAEELALFTLKVTVYQ